MKGGRVSRKGKIEQPAPLLITALPAREDAIQVLCPFLAGLDPAVAFWLGGLAWHDANGALLAALATPVPPGAQVYAGVFGVDPFRRDDDLFAALRRVGVPGVINLPTVSVMDGELGGILGSFQLGVEREIAFLLRARAAGFRIAGCVGSAETADQLAQAGADFLLAHGGPPQPGGGDPSRGAAERLRRRFAGGPPVVSVGELLRNTRKG